MLDTLKVYFVQNNLSSTIPNTSILLITVFRQLFISFDRMTQFTFLIASILLGILNIGLLLLFLFLFFLFRLQFFVALFGLICGFFRSLCLNHIFWNFFKLFFNLQLFSTFFNFFQTFFQHFSTFLGHSKPFLRHSKTFS